MFEYKQSINEIYSSMDEMLEARGIQKIIFATKIISAVTELEKGLDALSAQLSQNEQPAAQIADVQ